MRKLITILMAVFLLTATAGAQTRTVKGTVVDAANDEPLVGATVEPIGGGQAVATDIDGNFLLKVPASVKQIRVSYVGYIAETMAIRPDMVVKLTSTSENLDDLVVIAYGTASKESLTGSVAVINDKEIEKRPVSSVTSALEGMAPGVQVNGTTSTPGSSPAIMIRGINTVNGSTSPLYVVDGVVWNGGINDINPNDVENISVLKDAASCALYGSKGANGVVLITTKRAKNTGNVDVTARIRQGIYQRGLPQYERLGYDQWNETMLKAIANGNYSAAEGGSAPLTRQQAWDNAVNTFFSSAGVLNLYEDDAFKGSGENVFDKNGKIIKTILPGYDDLDWWDAISRNGYRQEYNVNATAATDRFNIFGSIGYLEEQGYLLKTDFERWTGRLRAEWNPVKYLRFGINLGGSSQNSNTAQFDSDNLSSTSNPFSYQTTAPGLPFYEHDWKTGEKIYDANGNPVWNTTPGYAAFVSNRGLILRENDSDYEYLALDANAFATIILPYGFDLTVRGTMNRWRQESTEYDSPVIGSAQGFGRLSKTFYTSKTHTFQQTLNWSHEFGNHHIDVMLNHENYSRYYHYTSVRNRDELFPGMNYMNNFTTNEGVGAYAFQYRTESYMGRARYNWNQQYFLEASITRDGSSRFSKESRWGTFWSLGASWILSKESFLQDVAWIDFLKARISYGTAGNDYTSGYYPSIDTWSKFDHTLNGNASIFPGNIGNKDLHWEATKTLDAALEGNLLNNRINFSVGYFLRTNSDLIYSVSQADSNGTTGEGGLTSISMNIGDMHNWGWEIGLGGDIIRNADLTVNLHADATFIKNKITKLPAGNRWTTSHALIEGKSRYEWYMPKWAGVDMTTGKSLYEINPCHKFDSEVFDENGNSIGWEHDPAKWESNLKNAEKAGELVKIGDKYYTTNTSYASNEFCGTSLPTVYGSFGSNIRWKGFNVGLLFTYSLGGKTLDGNYRSLMSTSAGGALHKDALNSWTTDMAEGYSYDSPDVINPNINPELNLTNNNNNNASSSRWLTSNNWLVFKNLNVSYDFPKKITSPLRLNGLNLGVSIDNVFTAAKRKGMNPSYSYSGGQGNYFVTSRVYSFELTVRF